MNLCWFCCHPGVRNIDPLLANKISLPQICEAHMDYEVYYKSEDYPMPVPMTPRLVLRMVQEMQREAMAGSN